MSITVTSKLAHPMGFPEVSTKELHNSLGRQMSGAGGYFLLSWVGGCIARKMVSLEIEAKAQDSRPWCVAPLGRVGWPKLVV